MLIRIDIVILSQFLARVLRGWGVYQSKLPNNMEVSEQGGGAVIKPSRPVTVCAAESSAYPTHAVPQKRHISGTFETVVGPPPLGQATTGGGCKIKIWLLYVVLLMQSGLVSIQLYSTYYKYGSTILATTHPRGVSCLTYQKLKSLSRPFICSNSGHSLSDKRRHYLLFWLFNK